MKDYYRILGIDRTASAEEIKRAYRRLASQHHPDKGGDTGQFQEIEEAYRTLSDPQQRSQYDNPATQSAHIHFGPEGFDLDGFFNMFGANFRQQQQSRVPRLTLWVGLRDVAEGGARTVALQIGNQTNNVEINIPPGLVDGDTIRYPGLAPNNTDLIITFRIKPEPGWSKDNLDLTTEAEINVLDLILGTDIQVQDIRGKYLLLNVPPGTQPGALLRMKGQGLPASTLPGKNRGGPGDMFVRLKARLPKTFSEPFIQAVRKESGR